MVKSFNGLIHNFINFSKYYFYHPKEYKVKQRKKRIERIPILDEQGKLIRKSDYEPEYIHPDDQRNKAKIKRIMLKFKAIFYSNNI